MKKYKKFISILLSFCLLFLCLSLTACSDKKIEYTNYEINSYQDNFNYNTEIILNFDKEYVGKTLTNVEIHYNLFEDNVLVDSINHNDNKRYTKIEKNEVINYNFKYFNYGNIYPDKRIYRIENVSVYVTFESVSPIPIVFGSIAGVFLLGTIASITFILCKKYKSKKIQTHNKN